MLDLHYRDFHGQLCQYFQIFRLLLSMHKYVHIGRQVVLQPKIMVKLNSSTSFGR